MSIDELARLDRESVAVWPCLREEALGGWIIRFGGGVYGRSNSVQPFGDPGLPLHDAVDACEAAYRAEGIRPMFRLPSCLSLDELDAMLIGRGYEISDSADVMVASTAGLAVDPSVRVDTSFDSDWFAAYLGGSGRGAGREAAVEALLNRMPTPRAFARVELEGRIGCVGLGSVHNGTVWLFGIATDPEKRGRGLGTKLVSCLMAWGCEVGASRAALQVSATNEPALAVYRKLGFEYAYRYEYRRLD